MLGKFLKSNLQHDLNSEHREREDKMPYPPFAPTQSPFANTISSVISPLLVSQEGTIGLLSVHPPCSFSYFFPYTLTYSTETWCMAL